MTLKPLEIIRLFENQGWKRLRQKGSHLVLGKGVKRRVIPIHDREMKKGLERKLLKFLEMEN